ncbi:MAG: potassium-transporting ATPase subunit KdpB [Spirochaetaceae bacterium]|nr:potassium-transporting ATPase subunit KdpB [Spirochaetaceae bacterium]
MSTSDKSKKKGYSFTKDMLFSALGSAFRKLDPRIEAKNPVMFIVWVGTVLCTVISVVGIIQGTNASSWSFELQIIIWLWFTLIFANFAESAAEVQGKARANSLRAMRDTVVARKIGANGTIVKIPSSKLRKGDNVVCEAGDIIPGDGEVVEGVASVDESAITGESAPVIREAGGDRSGVTGGTRVLSDRIVIRITADPGAGFVDKMIAMVENATRQKTPSEIALSILLSSLSIIFLLAVTTLYPFSSFIAAESKAPNILSIIELTSLLVCLIPTTIGSLQSAIGISGVSRLMQKNVMALSGRAIEAAGDIDTLLLDKTGTITYGNRRAVEIIPVSGIDERELAAAALGASLADETPEGKSIVYFIRENYDDIQIDNQGIFVPFSASTRMSGIDRVGADGAADPLRSVRKGAFSAVQEYVLSLGGNLPKDVDGICERIAIKGGTPLVVSVGVHILGVIHLKDVVKEGIKERFARLRAMGIKTVMITGDNRLTAQAIAAESGVSDFIPEAKPETKLDAIRKAQTEGHLVGMIGDGTNDAPALAQADLGIAMASGTQTAREAGNMVDFDNDPTKVIDVVEVGKQLLITRGSLTTFSIANDVAKYFAILPAVFSGFYAGKSALSGPLEALNIMHLATSHSAILSAVIFNALIIIALVPLALRGVKYSPSHGATGILRRNLLLYGLGGIIAPFVGIKLIDMLLVAIGFA